MHRPICVRRARQQLSATAITGSSCSPNPSAPSRTRPLPAIVMRMPSSSRTSEPASIKAFAILNSLHQPEIAIADCEHGTEGLIYAVLELRRFVDQDQRHVGEAADRAVAAGPSDDPASIFCPVPGRPPFHRLPAILAFLVGVCVSQALQLQAKRRDVSAPYSAVLVLEIGVLVVLSLLPATTADILFITSIAFAASVQVQLLRATFARWPRLRLAGITKAGGRRPLR